MAVDFTNGLGARNPKVQNGRISQEVIVRNATGYGLEDPTVENFRNNFFLEINSYPQGDQTTGTGIKVYGYTAFIVWEGLAFDPAVEPEFEIVTPLWEPNA